MFPIILIATFIGLLIGSIVLIRTDRDLEVVLGIVGGIISVGLLLAITITWPISYYTSVSEVTRMEAFYYDTLDAYEYTVVATGNIEITNADAGLVDVAYNEQGVATSNRLQELRDKIEWFNAKLRSYERFNSMFITDPFLANLPSGLAPITLSINLGGD